MTTLVREPDIAVRSSADVTFRTNRVELDGTYQAEDDGLNPEEVQWNIEWSAMNANQRFLLEGQLLNGMGRSVITWTPPNESAQKFIVEEYDVSFTGNRAFKITAKFIKVNDL